MLVDHLHAHFGALLIREPNVRHQVVRLWVSLNGLNDFDLIFPVATCWQPGSDRLFLLLFRQFFFSRAVALLTLPRG